MEPNLFEEIRNGEVLLSMEHITKIYDNGFVANSDVNFAVRKGEIHGLVGENGAGKTTLMKVLFGQEIPERGHIVIGGEKRQIKSPLDALKYGIGMVHQHFMLVDNLSVLDNMVLGSEPVRGILYDRKKAYEMVSQVSRKFDLEVDPDAIVGDLSVGLKQRVEILKILLKGAKLLLLDEPTAVLTPQETKELFRQLKGLKEKGYSIVFISHKLNEVKEICDRITVLRHGKSIQTADVDTVSEADISRMMVGYDITPARNDRSSRPQQPVLEVLNLSARGESGKYLYRNVNFTVRAGEIVGLAGVEGNGQSELSNTIAGIQPIQEGDILIDGHSIKGVKSVRDIRNLGVSLIHEDRMTYGVAVNQSIRENMMSDRYYEKPYAAGGVLDLKKEKADAAELARSFTVKCDGVESLVRTLSGGNIQKVVAAREFTSHPKFLLACQPTRGIDIGAAEMIRTRMLRLRDEEHTAVLLLSADLTELLTVSDRILVIYDGEIVAMFADASAVDEQILGEYMLGLKRMSEEEMKGAYDGNKHERAGQ